MYASHCLSTRGGVWAQLYLAILFVALRFPHQSRRDSPEWAALAKRAEGVGGKATPADDVLSVAWRARFGRLVALFLPERLLLGGALLAMGLGVPLSAGALVVIGRIFNNFYYPYAPESARGHLREYCLATVGIFAGAALLEGLYSTLVFVAAERMASRTRRKLFHNLLRQDVGFFDAHRAETLVKTVRADVALAQRSLGDHLFHGLHCLLNFSVAVRCSPAPPHRREATLREDEGGADGPAAPLTPRGARYL